jgi:hypothetical protein
MNLPICQNHNAKDYVKQGFVFRLVLMNLFLMLNGEKLTFRKYGILCDIDS